MDDGYILRELDWPTLLLNELILVELDQYQVEHLILDVKVVAK